MKPNPTERDHALMVLLGHFVDGLPAHPSDVVRALEVLRAARDDWATVGHAFLTAAARVNLGRLKAHREKLVEEIARLRPRDVH